MNTLSFVRSEQGATSTKILVTVIALAIIGLGMFFGAKASPGVSDKHGSLISAIPVITDVIQPYGGKIVSKSIEKGENGTVIARIDFPMNSNKKCTFDVEHGGIMKCVGGNPKPLSAQK